jgi:membrane-associated phospholipid phosphatase
MLNKRHKSVELMVEGAKEEMRLAHRPWYALSRVTQTLFIIYAIQLILFGLLAWWVHVTPVLSIDVAITREFQENQSPILRIFMLIISYPGSTFLLAVLVFVTAVIFWIVGLRLEAIFVLALSIVSSLLNVILKFLVARPRPNAQLVDVIQAAKGNSFPSGHVMAYLAFWGLLFSFGIIVFHGWHWWRVIILTVSAFFVILVGPSRIYLGDHWASDVLGSYLIGGVLLGVTLWIYLQLKQRGLMEEKHLQKV